MSRISRGMARVTTTAATALLAAAHAAMVGAQAPTIDSVRVQRVARAAQRDFELRRRANLPLSFDDAYGRCDTRIGRFCYWHDDAPAPRRVDEPRVIVQARQQLLRTLRQAATQSPHDGWITGQRVRYLDDAGLADSAVATARACTGLAWWCDALVGFALHQASQYAGADSAFTRALGEMPDDVRCDWSDLSALLDGPLADRYAHGDCAARQALDARVWWLARPFYSLPANDLRTEHFARLVMATVSQDVASPQGVPWGDDIRELVIRYGWPRWFTRQQPPAGSLAERPILGHDPEPSFTFLPDARLVDSAFTATPGDWWLLDPAARTRYAPRYATAVHDVPVQVARFVRGDSLRIVAAYDLSADSALAHDDLRVALVATPAPDSVFDTVVSPASVTGVLQLTVPRDSLIVGVEALASRERAGARVRLALVPPDTAGRLALSDVLWYAAGEEPPRTLDDAAALATAGDHVARGRPLGLYWEVYGSRESGEPADLSLTIERTGTSWWSRMRQRIGLGGGDTRVALRWHELLLPHEGRVERALGVDISRLDAGVYRVRLEVAAEDGAAAHAVRQLRIEE